MYKSSLQILPCQLLSNYCEQMDEATLLAYKNLQESELSVDNFSFYTSVSAVFSSKIEGEEIDLDSFVKHRRFNIEFTPDYTQKIDDLYNAYQFAKTAVLNSENIAQAHRLLTTHILPAHRQGKVRTSIMYVTTNEGKIEYVAASPFVVESELEKFFADIETLCNTDLSLQECFYFAALIHLVFVKIHPFDDGNGRTARLLEKWFLAQKLGDEVWLIQSEKFYYLHHQTYYHNIRLLGLEYEELDYNKAMPFLCMLAKSV